MKNIQHVNRRSRWLGNISVLVLLCVGLLGCTESLRVDGSDPDPKIEMVTEPVEIFIDNEGKVIPDDKISSLESDLERPDLGDIELDPDTKENANIQAAPFQYPYNWQNLDYGGHYMYKASYNYQSTRSAIAFVYNGHVIWNDYWGAAGQARTLNIWQGTYAHRLVREGRATVHMWYLINNQWAYQGIIQNGIRRAWVNPVVTSDFLSSDFGWRDLDGNGTQEDWHSGVDFGKHGGGHLIQGHEVRAVAAGRVSAIDASWGAVFVNHGNYSTVYGHMANIPVQIGTQLAQGSRVGTVSNTSPGSLPVHLHFEYYDHNVGGTPTFPNGSAERDRDAENPETNLCYTPGMTFTSTNNGSTWGNFCWYRMQIPG